MRALPVIVAEHRLDLHAVLSTKDSLFHLDVPLTIPWKLTGPALGQLLGQRPGKMQARTIETPNDIAEGLEALVRLDRRLAEVVERAGPVPLRRRTPGFEGLAHIIVSQMVSKAAATAIWERLVEEAEGCEPGRVAGLSDAQCRRIGVSRSKEATLKDAAEAVLSGRLDPEALCLMPAEAAIAAMTVLKGVGVWTAEVYLLFCAGHRDVFPAGDLALRRAAGRALDLGTRPDEKTLREIAGRWRPWRSVAARLLWAYYSVEVRRDAIPAVGEDG